ncbi:Mannosyl-oligosaccharide 1,2-alpha-mannosidase MNS1 [Smittium culicis]|uniref:alpha-1,2-Mannosidase n=1 Tax=Smittium culicis TaxID=133412 RepID=A0A1R1YMN4_9FUNG|nr:Mannosyl-oligosaccharide 1,2-alpha-mannosidase MNS1 [Smittium culicis]
MNRALWTKRLVIAFVMIVSLNYMFNNISSSNGPNPKSQSKQDSLNEERRNAVKGAMKHAWKGYSQFAFGRDEIHPVSKSWNNSWSVTLLDSLDTLYIMGMREEFNDAVAHVSKIDFNKTTDFHSSSLFESVIRCLGGLLSAYELSGEKILLDKAVEVGEALYPCLNHKSGIPVTHININEKMLMFNYYILVKPRPELELI